MKKDIYQIGLVGKVCSQAEKNGDCISEDSNLSALYLNADRKLHLSLSILDSDHGFQTLC